MKDRVAQVPGVLAERVVLSTTLDPFLTLKAASDYTQLSVLHAPTESARAQWRRTVDAGG